MEQASIPRPARRSRLRASARELVDSGARDWRARPRTIAALLAFPPVLAVLAVLVAAASKPAYKLLIGEDRIAESIQVILYVGGLVLALSVLRHLLRSGERSVALLYCGLCLGLLFMIGEELSWGQRVFGWETPASLAANNKQEESNLHNVHGVGATFKWVQLLVGAYGALLPLVLLRARIGERARRTLWWLVPPVTLVPYFGALFVWRVFRNLVETPQSIYFAVEEYNEVMELLFAAGGFLFLLYLVRWIRAGEPGARPRPRPV